METKDHLLQTLEHFKQQRSTKMQEVRSLDVIIRRLEQELGGAVPSSEATETMNIAEQPLTANANGVTPQVRPDEFFSMTQTDAAKAYLKKVLQAISMDQLLDGMRRGGAHVGGADPKATLYVSLMRNPKREFVKVGEGFIGLREFYPSLPKSIKNGVKKATRGSRSRRKLPKPRRSSKPDKQNVADTGKASDHLSEDRPRRFPRLDPNEVKEAICKVIADGQLHTGRDILKGVSEKFAFKVNPVVVYGCLRGKEFERIEKEYRLRK